MKTRNLFLFVAVILFPLCLRGDDPDGESELLQRVKSMGGEIDRESSNPQKPISGLFFDCSKRSRTTSSRPGLLKFQPKIGNQNNELSDETLKELLEFPELSHVSAVDIFFSSRLTDHGMFQLAQIETLRRLNLGECHGITDEGLKAFEGNDKLTFLALQNCKKITDEGLKSIGQMTGLKFLLIRGCKQITDSGIAELKNLEHLTNLDLQRIHVTGAGLKELNQLSNLRTLYLSSRDLKDADLQEIEGMKRLGLLELIGCDRITDKGVKELHQANSKLLIVRRAVGVEVLSR